MRYFIDTWNKQQILPHHLDKQFVTLHTIPRIGATADKMYRAVKLPTDTTNVVAIITDSIVLVVFL
jgi:hypothetical protein